MIKKLNITVALLLTFFALNSHGIDVSEISQWDKKHHYQRGDLINHKQIQYLAVFPSTGFTPKKHKWVWRKLN